MKRGYSKNLSAYKVCNQIAICENMPACKVWTGNWPKLLESSHAYLNGGGWETSTAQQG